HQRRLDLLFAVNLELAQLAFATDPRLVETSVRGYARALDLLAGGDFGFLQRLAARHLQLLDRAPPLQPCRFQHLLASDVGRLDRFARVDLGLFDLAIGIDPLRALTRKFDYASLIGKLDRLLLVDIENLSHLRRSDPLRLQRQLHLDPAPLDRFAPFQVGRLDRLRARDLQPP